jgi:two-component system cell cycle sensor histidine kinase/response regulator CckA
MGLISPFASFNVLFQLKTPAGESTISRYIWPQPDGDRRNREVTPLDYYRGSETILVVDDEESLRTVVVDLLGQLGYRMLSASSGDEALALADNYSGKIDLLLTDVVMDPIPGPDLAQKLGRTRPDMKVVFISGYATSCLAPDGVLKPGTVLVNKPFTMKALSAKLREVLESRASA